MKYKNKITEVDVGIIGAPWDAGTTNRPGPRHGPRQVRDMSTMIRAQHGVSNLRPFDLKNCAALIVIETGISIFNVFAVVTNSTSDKS